MAVSRNSLTLVIPLQLVLAMLLHTRTDWLLCTGYYLLSLCYFFWRLVDLSPNAVPHYGFVVTGLVYSFLSYAFMAYWQVKTEKTTYKSLHESFETLNYFKSLLQNIIPSPIFITDYKRKTMEFANNSGMNLIGSGLFSEMEFSAKKNLLDRSENDNLSSSLILSIKWKSFKSQIKKQAIQCLISLIHTIKIQRDPVAIRVLS